ncbi:unnamed protein product [Lymnaea stagnalis]|uniref:Sulfotransferase domain-containing protein n=1 Tax=Lymnaea stagnalis TaxID=6523 RepID=A0AAV2I7X8_LYMST
MRLTSNYSHRRERTGFTVAGSRFIKENCRWLFPMFRWRTFLPRCNPQCGFSFIIGAVVLFLISYLYISHRTRVGRPFRLGQLGARLHNGAHIQGSGRRNAFSSTDVKIPKPRRRWEEKAEAQNESGVEGTVSWRQVSDVINLMAKMTPDDPSSGKPAVQSEVLMRQIKELTEAMLSEKTMLPKLQDPPMCVGDLKEGEVEDIFCIPKPNYLSHIKNPCWYTDEMFREVKVRKLNCLPYFHILGCAKSGTTDLWNRLMSHPHVVSNDGLLHKEGLWWSWRRYGISGYNRNKVMNFSEYVDLFQDTARQIQASVESDSLLQQILITGDASPPDFWDFRGWTNISQNRNHHIPRVITPHLMKHFYTNPKFILMFRDPIERLYSDYFFVGGGLTSLDFHNDVLASINLVHSCVKRFGLVSCFYDHRLYIKLPVRLPFACYSVFMREWLQVFPKENFLLIKTEEYDEDSEATLKEVMAFLGLGPLRENVLQEITEEERSRVTVQRKIAGPMRNATREILHSLLDPCGLELARLLKNDKFTWS